MKRQTLITTTLLVIVVFSIGIILGSAWKSMSANEVSKLLRQSELDAESFLVEQELFERFETNCELAQQRISALSEELWKLGKVLGAPDAKIKLGEEDYSFLKRKYHLMQIRTYILDKQLSTNCESTTNVVLFYFKQGDPLSEQQGRILDDLVLRYDIHVFAIEHAYSKELSFLEDYYSVASTPSLVVNFDTVLSGLVPSENLIPLLHGQPN